MRYLANLKWCILDPPNALEEGGRWQPMQQELPLADLCGYALSLLRRGELALYRGRGDGLRSILLVTPPEKSATLRSLECLEHEYSLRAELDPTWAVRPISLTRRDDRVALILEDQGGQLLDQFLDQPLDVPTFLRIAIPLASAVGRLHERALIHKDIKPANILVDLAEGRVWLTGFGSASRLPSERQPPEPAEVLVGTLAYMPPEQTGRMNRSVDSRSDLYALGVTFYQMLAGQLPFTASDPLELVHCHIARQPISPRGRVSTVPEQISSIIMKLLSKTAEDRYQTADGVESDLRHCLSEWNEIGCIGKFPLGAHDHADRLRIPEKLYGRGREIDCLLASFERVVQEGTPELVLVSGYSGIGKSSIVNELHRALVPPRALFASGKVDQYVRDAPYVALTQAIQGLVRLLLGKSQGEIERWRELLCRALDSNGQLLMNLVPELMLIIGQQPMISDLPPRDAQNRFELVFRRFLAVFARAEHPLVLFLDDLQWADARTLDLIEDFLTQPDVRHLMLIGAYRDNEVESAHPLMRKLEAIRKAGVTAHEIVVAPLQRNDLEQLIVDTVRCPMEQAAPLARLLEEKTDGNPFFVIQFLTGLADEGLLVFDRDAGQWTWDLAQIEGRGFTDNVVDLMIGKLMRLPPSTQDTMKRLACLGNRATVDTLRIVEEKPVEEIAAVLRDPLHMGLIFRSEGAFAFLHDRVQEAAYALLPGDNRATTHLRIGRLLAARTPSDKISDSIFDIVNQLNRGAALIVSAGERDRAAELNLIAGRRAQAAAAFPSALAYFTAGDEMLDGDRWERQYPLAFELALRRAETEFLTGDSGSAEARLAALARRAASLVDRAAVTCLRLDLYMTLGRSDRAVETGLEYLRSLGVAWSAHPTEEEVRDEYGRIWSQLGDRSIRDLIDLPAMMNSQWRASMDVLTKIMPPALFTDKNLQCLVLGRMANLSLEHGNCDGSCLGYVWLGGVLGPHFGDYQAGFQFGELSVDLVNQLALNRFMARVYLGFGSLVIPWSKHVRTGLPVIRRALDAAQETGDVTYAAFAYYDMISQRLANGDSLDEVQREAENALDFVLKSRFGLIADSIVGQLRLILTLRGQTPKFGIFDDAGFDEVAFERHLESDPHLANATCRYWTRKLQARVYANDTAAASKAAAKAASLLWALPPSIEAGDYYFYAALALSGHFGPSAESGSVRQLEALSAHHTQLAVWARNCPETFENRAALVAGEIARLKGQDLDAMHHYEDAIKSAREHGFIQNEAIANEAAAKFYADRGFATIAVTYLRSARFCYLRWGAEGKVRHLEQYHPQLREEPTTPSAGRPPGVQLDVAALVGASQAISSELLINPLIQTLMKIVIQYAGAERGLLVLLFDERPKIVAEATAGKAAVSVTLRQADAAATELPEAILNTVIRTRQTVILNDARRTNQFSADGYIQQRRPRSVLCLALVRQTKLVGLLYLENNLVPDAFTLERISLLELLTSQAAISLEIARLYSELITENLGRRKTEKELRHSEALLSQAQEISRIGSWRWDAETDELSWSREQFRIFGLNPDERPSLAALRERIHPFDRAGFEQTLERAKQERQKYSQDYRIVLPDGSTRSLHSIAQPFIDPNGKVEFVGTVMDVTERRDIEQSLRSAQSELARASRITAMGQMAASIAHEVSQPLTAIVANASACLHFLADGVRNLDEAREGLHEIVNEGHRAGHVISSVRAMFKKESPEKILVDVNEIIRDVISMVNTELQRQQIAAQTVLSEDVPRVRANRVLLQQVILNLINNAIEAMSMVADRTRVLRVTSAPQTSSHALITVEDSGMGFDAKDVERIFEPFFTTKSDGTGMGLAICRSIVEDHGGRLSASSHAGIGSTFAIELPGQAQAHAVESIIPSRAAISEGSSPVRGAGRAKRKIAP